MKSKILILAMLSGLATAQTTLESQIKTYSSSIENMIVSEKAKMKEEIQRLEDRYNDGKISKEELVAQKSAVSKKYETIINDRIEAQRDKMDSITKSSVVASVFGINKNAQSEARKIYKNTNSILEIDIKQNPTKIKSSTISVAYGLLNLTEDRGSFNPFEENSQMRIGNSHSFEIQFRKDRQLGATDSQWFIRYGLAYRSDTYMPKSPLVFAQDAQNLYLENFALGSLKRSKFRNVYLTIPVEFQFLLNPKFSTYDGKNYIDARQKMWKIGLGVYAGVKTRSIAKVKYYNDGGKFDKYQTITDHGVNSFLFGGKLTVGYGGFNIFIKKDFTPVFNDNAKIPFKNAVQVGVELVNIDF